MNANAWYSHIVLYLGMTIFLLGVIRLVLFVPLAVWFDLRRGQVKPNLDKDDNAAEFRTNSLSLSVVIPAYNEAVVLEPCIHSLMASTYPIEEIALIDDGSSDNTYDIMQELAARYEIVTAYTKPNGGKASALNFGIERIHSQAIICCDADGVFHPETLQRLVEPLTDPRIGAVCGDDRTLNTNVLQTKFLALISHVGTGLTRRALHLLGCLPIVSGNIGAFSRTALTKAGPFNEHVLGEDLEMTWRIHRVGFQVAFEPSAIVFAESPCTARGLWRQRVRWARGFLQTAAIHKDMIGSRRYGTFGFGLIYFVMSAGLVPFAQFLTLPTFLGALITQSGRGTTLWEWWVGGLIVSALMLLIAIILNHAWRDIKYLWLLPVWPVYSTYMGAAFIRAAYLELRKAPQRWNKLDRSGVRTVDIPAAEGGPIS